MSNAHKGSKLVIDRQLQSIDNNTTALFHFDITENDVLTGIAPTQNITTLLSYEGKFGGGIAVEEAATNLWAGGFTPYNNYGVPTTSVDTGETYMGQPIRRIGFTVDDAHSANLSHFQTTLTSHGVYGGSLSWVQDTMYASSIYWRPVNKPDMVFGGTASNTAGWSSGGNEILSNGWRRFYRYRTGVGVVTKSDVVHHSFYCPSLQLNETIYFEVCCPQTESGRIFPTSYISAGGSRADGGIAYDSSNIILGNQLTTSCWFRINGWDKRNTGNPYQMIIHHYGWYVAVNRDTGKIGFWSRSPLGGWYHSTSTVTFKNWYFVVVTYDNANLKIYVNGILESITSVTGSIPQTATNRLSIGFADGESGRRLNGIVDELRIDNIARTDEEIMSWYISNSPFYPKGIYRIAY